MADFPTLSQGPNVADFDESVAVDPTLRTEFENGYQLTRNRFTVVPKTWRLIFEHLTSADKTLLDTFEKTTVGYGGDEFDWENTEDGTTYTVKFAAPIKWRLNPLNPKVPLKRWRAEITLVEANPSS